VFTNQTKNDQVWLFYKNWFRLKNPLEIHNSTRNLVQSPTSEHPAPKVQLGENSGS